MNMNTDEGWLRRKAEQEDGCFVSVGGLEALGERVPSPNVVPMKTAFVQFVQLTRRVRRLSLEEFAEKTDVDLAELVKIETEEHHKTTFRTVHKIADFLEVPERNLLALAGLQQVIDSPFKTPPGRFAARSSPVEKLTLQEHSDLDEIVKFLCER